MRAALVNFAIIEHDGITICLKTSQSNSPKYIEASQSLIANQTNRIMYFNVHYRP